MKQNDVNKRRTILTVTEAVETTLAASSFFSFRQRQEKGTEEVEKKNSDRNKYLQVVVTGQTCSHVQFNKKQRVRDEFTLVRKS